MAVALNCLERAIRSGSCSACSNSKHIKDAKVNFVKSGVQKATDKKT
jgi:hypothetical protein